MNALKKKLYIFGFGILLWNSNNVLVKGVKTNIENCEKNKNNFKKSNTKKLSN